MLTYWILGALPYLINSAVIPNQQVRPFEDPPPSNEFFMFSSKQKKVETPQQDMFDAFQAAVVPAKFILRRNYPQYQVPFQEYSDTISGPTDRQLLFSGSSPIVNAIPVRLIEAPEQPVQNTFFYKLSSFERTGEEPSRKVILQDSPGVAEETLERLKTETDGSLSNVESRYYAPHSSDGIDEPSEETSETRDNPYSVENYEIRNENDYRYPAEDYRGGLPDTSNEIIEDRRPIDETPIIIEIIPDTVIQVPRESSEEYQPASDQNVGLADSNIPEQRFPIVLDVPQERFIQNTPFRSVDNTRTFSESNDDLPELVGSQKMSPTSVNILPSVSTDSPKVSDGNDATSSLISNSKDDVPNKMDGSAEKYPTENSFQTKSFSAHSSIISVLPVRNISYYDGSERNRTNEVADLLEPLPERNIQKREALMNKEPGFTLTDAPRYFHKLLLRNKRTSSPAVDSVDENPSHWRPQNLPKAQFITKRGPLESTSDPLRTYSDRSSANPSTNADIASYRSNEIPLSERDRSGYLEEPRRYEYTLRDSDTTYRPREGRLEDYDRRLAPRRIIYYANLPEVVRQGDPRDAYRSTEYGRYDFGRSSSKFPRESRFNDPVVRSPPLGVGHDDRYRDRYRPTSTPTSYTIIDAERVPARSPVRAPYPQRPYQDIDSQTRYNRIPAPYQPNQPGGATYEQFRKPSSVPPRTIGNPAPEPYRDYNPHQPAHWSMQVGTSLTVKDDGRPYNSGRRFYVHSQEQQPYSPARYPRVEDDPRHRL